MKTWESKGQLRAEAKKEIHNRLPLTMFFSVMLFFIMTIAMAAVGIIIVLLVQEGVMTVNDPDSAKGTGMVIIINAVISIIVGTILAAFFSKIPLKPVNSVIDGMNELASGKYETRINLGKKGVGKDVSDSFNKLACELQNTEMLRADFVNNFSHEFKTPIVSILGFAKILKKGNLSDVERTEYLDIIEEEAERLSKMATNVLDLTKVENQTILTDVTCFNLSEQIRSCVILLEKNWTVKNIDMQIDFDEFTISGNEEMLKQVWINLVDNAIKFSPENGQVEIKIENQGAEIAVHVINQGVTISEEDKKRIFNKFYQADVSHSSKGNGIGLAVVKRVVELHDGTVDVGGGEGTTDFTVILPKSIQ